MGLKSNDTNTKLVGYGLGGILILITVLGVELFNEGPPSATSLQSFSGQLVDKQISREKNRIFADIQVRNGAQEVILFQQVSEKLSADIQKLSAGKTVTALIAPKEFVDQRTGLDRYSMWQLAVNEQELFSYDEITQFIDIQNARWRTFAYWAGAIGVACLIGAALSSLLRRQGAA